jgi:hypothetical protein
VTRRLTPGEQKNLLVVLIVVLVFILAMTIALGKVEKDTSYGLEDAIRFLTILGAGVAFGHSGNPPAEK